MTNIIIDKLQMKRGNRATIPVLDDGEPAICLDTKEFAIGTPDGNLYFSFQDLSDLVNEVGNAKSGYASLQEKLNSLASTGGGAGVLVHQTLTDLQTAYPNGTTQPAWIVADNAWYYWSGAVADTTVPTVTMSPAAGLYNTSKSVTLTANETATIYYTTDGTTPTTSSTVYSSPISISATTTLKYFAKDTAGNSSTVQTAVFTIDTVLPVLTITAGGTFTGTKSVTMSVNETADIYYTLDGSTPTTSSMKYTSALSITATTTLKAFAKDTAGNSSAVQTVTYTLDASAPADTTAPTVTASPASGTYTSAQSVTLTANETATIYYTTNGTTPTTASTVYTGPISISATTTLQFIAKDTAGNTSTPVAATYTINIPDTTAPVLTITPAATFTDTQTVTMSTNETATIWYTVDGTDPTSSGTKAQYSSPVTLTATTTVKAYAVDSANNASAVQTVTYTKQASATYSYLSFNGTSDYLKTPSLTFTDIEMDFQAVQSNTVYQSYFDARTGVNLGYMDNNASGSDTYNAPIWKEFIVDGVTKTGLNANLIPRNTRTTVKFTLNTAGTDDVNILSGYQNNNFMQGKIYSIKFYNAGTLVAWYDMTKGNVQDQSGNGKNATLNGGTWV